MVQVGCGGQVVGLFGGGGGVAQVGWWWGGTGGVGSWEV